MSMEIRLELSYRKAFIELATLEGRNELKVVGGRGAEALIAEPLAKRLIAALRDAGLQGVVSVDGARHEL